MIKADPTQVHQIIMNLTTNAYHAMEESDEKLKVSLVVTSPYAKQEIYQLKEPIQFGTEQIMLVDNEDAIITDMAMPNMSGNKLSVELNKILPYIPVLICTGFSETMLEEKSASLGIKLYRPIVLP